MLALGDGDFKKVLKGEGVPAAALALEDEPERLALEDGAPLEELEPLEPPEPPVNQDRPLKLTLPKEKGIR